jgi:DNA-binding GntR family transcriptional regulator
VTASVNATPGEPSLAERAYAGLRDLIVTLRLAPGSALQEETLGAQLGVGRTPLREAIKRLEVEQLVTVYPRRGTFVAPIAVTDHGFICDVRRSLEGLAAQLAARNATDRDRRELQGLASTLRRHPGGRRAAMQLDTMVHRQIYTSCHNPYLAADLDRYYNLSLRIWYLLLERLPEVDHAAEHLPMIESILDGDAASARAHAERHVTHFHQSVRDAL